jgi:CspA family cold shock protein
MPRGTVVEFDEAKGYGAVEDGERGTRYFFHCTQIADGSRTIDSGAAVEFDVVAGRMGRWEAVALRP